ncbi:uncharacterized protein LOC113238987 [Hyposmocoma kahamanoa]|uniref:uncharacterized protein LOC113238987 n=1 Tax=Hyposmocoma kahamanoa TaxID=1477025 RepID=UPI000E6D639D|nr:uncharacterized protein LOC113238987 [Hyposmocoma kahamanoa]
MRIIPLIVLLACLAWPANARAQDEGEARLAPSRGLLKRGLLAKGKATTTTTPAPLEETEYEDEADYVDEAQEPSTEAPSSSTEGKKLVAGGVRPFRSNADLLEALKRRRAQAAEAKLHGQSQVAAAAPAQDAPVEPTPVKSSYSKKRFNTPAKESKTEEAAGPVKPGRGRFGRPSSRAVQEESEEQNESAPAPIRTGRTFRRGN